MKKLLKKVMAATLCMGLFLVVGCKKDNPVVSGGGIEEPKPEYPIIVPFTEYTLPETCQWKNLDYNEKVIIINNDRELGIYTACEGGYYPEVDFEKQTLLLASGSASRGVEKITVNHLQQLSENDYELNIELLLYDSDTIAAEKWILALIIEKISSESMVKLTITEYPIEIPFEEYCIHHDHTLRYWDNEGVVHEIYPCWKNLNHDFDAPDYVWGGKIAVINSDEELENYLICPEDYSAIDFSRHTLVLASGITAFSPIKIYDIGFIKTSANQYALKTTISTSLLCTGEYWWFAIIIPKIENESTVLLSITQKKHN